jgi:hypothetical protein
MRPLRESARQIELASAMEKSLMHRLAVRIHFLAWVNYRIGQYRCRFGAVKKERKLYQTPK